MKADTEKAVEKTGGGIETMDVKAALIAREQAKGYKIDNQLSVVPK